MSGEGHTDWVAGVAFHPKVCHPALLPPELNLSAVMLLLCQLSLHVQLRWALIKIALGGGVKTCMHII